MTDKLFVRLCLNYGKEPNQELYNFWKEELEIFDAEDIENIFNRIMKNDKYFPNLSRIYEEIKKISFKEITTSKKIERMHRINVIPIWLERD